MNRRTHSRSSLYLTELLLAVLVLAVSCAACIRLFAAAYHNRQEARQWNHIKTLTVTAGETLEAWDTETPFSLPFYKGLEKDGAFFFYFDRHWEECVEDKAEKLLVLVPASAAGQKTIDLSFFSVSAVDRENGASPAADAEGDGFPVSGRLLEHLQISFPAEEGFYTDAKEPGREGG